MTMRPSTQEAKTRLDRLTAGGNLPRQSAGNDYFYAWRKDV
jgi:hypothetical protein